MSDINWRGVGSIPRTPFTNITVKDANGDLYNVTTDRHGQINAPVVLPLQGWIPNDQV